MNPPKDSIEKTFHLTSKFLIKHKLAGKKFILVTLNSYLSKSETVHFANILFRDLDNLQLSKMLAEPPVFVETVNNSRWFHNYRLCIFLEPTHYYHQIYYTRKSHYRFLIFSRSEHIAIICASSDNKKHLEH